MRLDDFTMVIPTYNRPHMLARALSYYASAPVTFRVIVADSSSHEIQKQNGLTIDPLPMVEHVSFPSTMRATDKFGQLPKLINTRYGMLTADDDITLPGGIVDALMFLRENPDFVGCHGTYYNASLVPDNTALRVGIEYEVASHAADEPLARLMSLAMRYQSIAYSVQRSDAMRAASPPPSISTDHFWELDNAFRLLVAGKVQGLLTPFMVRNSQLGPRPDFIGDPNNWLLHDSTAMISGYHAFRAALAPALAGLTSRTPESIIDLVYAVYFSRSLSPGTILSRLELEGDLRPGCANTLLGLPGRRNTITSIDPRVTDTLERFTSTGWPQYN